MLGVVPAAIQQGSVTVLVNWLSSNFLQLVLLPIIIVGQNVISAAQDARAAAKKLPPHTIPEPVLKIGMLLAPHERHLGRLVEDAQVTRDVLEADYVVGCDGARSIVR